MRNMCLRIVYLYLNLIATTIFTAPIIRNKQFCSFLFILHVFSSYFLLLFIFVIGNKFKYIKWAAVANRLRLITSNHRPNRCRFKSILQGLRILTYNMYKEAVQLACGLSVVLLRFPFVTE
jgi:hypothetical protein